LKPRVEFTARRVVAAAAEEGGSREEGGHEQTAELYTADYCFTLFKIWLFNDDDDDGLEGGERNEESEPTVQSASPTDADANVDAGEENENIFGANCHRLNGFQWRSSLGTLGHSSKETLEPEGAIDLG